MKKMQWKTPEKDSYGEVVVRSNIRLIFQQEGPGFADVVIVEVVVVAEPEERGSQEAALWCDTHS